MKYKYEVGQIVKPMKYLKRAESSWGRHFSNKPYPIKGFDSLDGQRLLVLKTGQLDYEYDLVYEDEVVLIK